MENFQRIIISRTDSIGDVILSLPVAGILKNAFPEAEIIFLGRSYTSDVIRACEYVDTFMNWDEIQQLSPLEKVEAFKNMNAGLIIHVFPRAEIASIAKKAGIPLRMGTSSRLYHWFSCNRLVRLSRRKSDLHEAQLNLMLIKSITEKNRVSHEEIASLYGLTKTEKLEKKFSDLIDRERYNLILHPKSKGSAREWGLENFKKLVHTLPAKDFKIFVSGTAEEGMLIKESGFFKDTEAIDLSGSMSLGQLMSFIQSCDGLVAASTGPLHLAAALGITAAGIYPPIRPMHPGRWAPIGKKAKYIVKEKSCNDCRKGGSCHCMQDISPEEVRQAIADVS
ncbi:MAG: glycosyltransferase family 9 protein [Bacteroidetes bacterium]|nr:glycosyltransferase family 9 protein [Bacteroidota bacterium]